MEFPYVDIMEIRDALIEMDDSAISMVKETLLQFSL